MRIISKFRDYYDSIQAYGQDENVIFIRKNEKIHEGIDDILRNYFYRKDVDYLGEPRLYFENYYSSKYRGVDISGGFSVFFCGERFNAVKTRYIRKSRNYLISETEEIKIHYSKEALDNYIDTLPIEKVKRDRNVGEIVDFFNLPPAPADLHFRMDTPIFVIGRFGTKRSGLRGRYSSTVIGIEKNPDLSALDFTKVKDPYSAYQELDMFISGVMGGRSPVMAEVSDEDMKNKKGFGHKYAFKTEPTKRRKS